VQMDEKDGSFWDKDDRLRRVRLLEASGMAQAADTPLSVTELANELHVSSSTIRIELEELSRLGLIFDGLEEGLSPVLRNAGRQFLAGRSAVRHEVLRFLPHVIDDLYAREALLHGGTVIVDEFRAAFLDGDPVEHVRELAFGWTAPTGYLRERSPGED
jgi:hypothetical protein